VIIDCHTKCETKELNGSYLWIKYNE